MAKDYVIELPGGKSKRYTEDEFSSPNVQNFLQSDQQYKVYELQPLAPVENEDTKDDIFTLTLPNGNSKTYSNEDYHTPNVQRFVEDNKDVKVERTADRRTATNSWTPAEGAQGYFVHWGTDKDELFAACETLEPILTLGLFSSDVDYYFRVDSFNESGVTMGKVTKKQ